MKEYLSINKVIFVKLHRPNSNKGLANISRLGGIYEISYLDIVSDLQETQRMTTVVEGIVAESRVVLQRIDIDDKVSTPLASVKYHI
ncbi:MAG: hypothetical protein WBM37_14300 [Nitrososphaeraceae archaeon]